MNNRRQFGGLFFEAEFVFAVNEDQKEIKFSKQERALLVQFTKNAGLIQSRDRLLNVIHDLGSDVLDRNIDYLISRLRRKLGDSANSSRYIATQYGEGYIWLIAESKTPQTSSLKPVRNTLPSNTKNSSTAPVKSRSIYLSVGPCYGLKNAQTLTPHLNNFSEDLIKKLVISMRGPHLVEAYPERSTANSEDLWLHQNARYAIEISFILQKEQYFCSVVLLNRRSGVVFGTIREEVTLLLSKSDIWKFTTSLTSDIKEKLRNAHIFRDNEQRTTGLDTLAVGLYKARHLFEPDQDKLPEIEKSLRQHLKEKPEDHKSAIMLATVIHTSLYSADIEKIEEKHQEMEILLLEHLPFIQDDALYLSSAAEKLHLLGHRELGESLAHRALDIGPSYAACYLVLGRISTLRGDLHEGIAYYKHALEMVEKDEPFAHMLVLMICIAYKAHAVQESVREWAPTGIELETDAYRKMGLEIYFYADDPEYLQPYTRTAIESSPAEAAAYMLNLFYQSVVKNFQHESHRENLLRGPVSLFAQSHGLAVISDEIRKGVPNLMARLKE